MFHQFFTKIDLLQISKKKPNCLILFLLGKCSIIDNGSKIPSFLHPKTDKSLSNTTSTGKDIEKFIKNLDSKKAHEHDIISIRMLKICGKSITKSLLIIYKKCLEKACFPNEWKKANVVSVHKKMTNSYQKAIDQYLYCQSAVKFW